jgi:hypothetical protein
MNLSKSYISTYDQISLKVLAGNTSTKLVFPDQPYLRNKAITNVAYFTNSVCAYDINGIPTAADSYLQSAFLTLYIDERTNIYRIPLSEISPISNAATMTNANTNGVQILDARPVVWTKSYIELAAGFAAFATDVVFLFGVQYIK